MTHATATATTRKQTILTEILAEFADELHRQTGQRVDLRPKDVPGTFAMIAPLEAGEAVAAYLEANALMFIDDALTEIDPNETDHQVWHLHSRGPRTPISAGAAAILNGTTAEEDERAAIAAELAPHYEPPAHNASARQMALQAQAEHDGRPDDAPAHRPSVQAHQRRNGRQWYEIWTTGPANPYTPELIAKVKSEGAANLIALELCQVYRSVEIR